MSRIILCAVFILNLCTCLVSEIIIEDFNDSLGIFDNSCGPAIAKLRVEKFADTKLFDTPCESNGFFSTSSVGSCAQTKLYSVNSDVLLEIYLQTLPSQGTQLNVSIICKEIESDKRILFDVEESCRKIDFIVKCNGDIRVCTLQTIKYNTLHMRINTL